MFLYINREKTKCVNIVFTAKLKITLTCNLQKHFSALFNSTYALQIFFCSLRNKKRKKWERKFPFSSPKCLCISTHDFSKLICTFKHCQVACYFYERTQRVEKNARIYSCVFKKCESFFFVPLPSCDKKHIRNSFPCIFLRFEKHIWYNWSVRLLNENYIMIDTIEGAKKKVCSFAYICRQS